MILYFSATGNSRHLAERLAEQTGDAVLDMGKRIKSNDITPIEADGRLIFVTPTYAWRIPRIAETWIRAIDFRHADRAWFVMTCGSEIGNAAKYNARLCSEKGMSYMGTAQVIMPENYIAMFRVPGKEEAAEIVERAELKLADLGSTVSAGIPFRTPRKNLYDRFMSSSVNPLFYRFVIKTDAFRADERCVSCGKCAALCPLNNIRIENGTPIWGKQCTHCMACIAHCPTQAIEYGKKSAGKPRYHLD